MYALRKVFASHLRGTSRTLYRSDALRISCITAYFSRSSGVKEDSRSPNVVGAGESVSGGGLERGEEDDDGGGEEAGEESEGDEQAVEEVEASERPLEYAVVIELATEYEAR